MSVDFYFSDIEDGEQVGELEGCFRVIDMRMGRPTLDIHLDVLTGSSRLRRLVRVKPTSPRHPVLRDHILTRNPEALAEAIEEFRCESRAHDRAIALALRRVNTEETARHSLAGAPFPSGSFSSHPKLNKLPERTDHREPDCGHNPDYRPEPAK